MSNCIFCKIANHEIPGKILYEDNDCIAFLDLSQTTKGHTLVIPKAHAKSVLEIDQDNLAKSFKVAQNMANMLKTKLNANGVNIITNSGIIAGQTIEHFHLHVIPRFDENDTFEINFTDNSQICNLDEVFKIIKE
ncbi:MAG: HIT family protein [Erysipelotrichaceae bacterium]|nr:HIT family protein [Erysipelotrichaceae bacterium]MDD3808661.1 HIT family protein [Erysipelotrichaceae bacterium]